mgnify:CR=1 FL=1
MQARQPEHEVDAVERTDSRPPNSESAFVRNYDSAEARTVTVTVIDSDDETVVERSVTVSPSAASSLRFPLERGVYRVEVRLADGTDDSAMCPIGSDPEECAVVECGNGIVSVTTLAEPSAYRTGGSGSETA